MALNIRSMAPVIELTFGFCLLATLTQVTLAKDELYIDVLSFNSSTVELACRYEGDKTEIFFKVYKKKYACFYHKSTCEYYPQPECDFQCKETGNENMVSFSVNLNGSCQQQVVVRCFVRTSAPGQDLEMDTFLVLPAQSDSPEITVHKDQPLEVSLEPVTISCTVSNRCSHTPLEISGIHMSSLEILHKSHGSRYNTTVETTAIFNEAGNYTINCREAGNQGNFSSNITVEIIHHEGEPQPTAKGIHTVIVGSVLSAVILALTLLLCFFGIRWCNLSKKYRDYKYHEVSQENITEVKEEGVQADVAEAKEKGVQADLNSINRSEEETNDSLLWRCANQFSKERTFTPQNIDVLTNLIRGGAYPFTDFCGTSVCSIFLHDSNFHHQQASSFLSALAFFEEVLKIDEFSKAKGSTLNDIVKSVPMAIDNDSNHHSIEKVLLKMCHKMMKTTLPNHVDNEGRTPLHNLMAKLGIDDIWRIAKLDEETDNFLHLLYRLTIVTNLNIRDKDSVTPYSWILWWKESVAYQEVKDTQHINRVLSRFNEQPDENDRQGLEYLRKTEKVKNVIKLRNSVCSLWTKTNEENGKRISHFIESGQNPRKVYEAEIKNPSYIKKYPNYIGYFAVISPQCLNNHNFCVYLMLVLRRLAFFSPNNKSTFVLVVVDRDAVSLLENARDKTIHWPIDLQAIPRVDASSYPDDEILNQIVSKLQGPPLNPGVSPFVGNVGVGLAWDIFQYNFAFMLPGITERIAKSEAYKKYAGKMSKHYIIIIPESYEIALEIKKEGIPRSKRIGDLDGGIKIERDGWHPRDVEERVWEITSSQGNCYYCCYKYISVPYTLEYMLESGEMTEDEVKRQYSLYVDTRRSILCDPLYNNHALVLNCKDYSTLPDDLCDLITSQNKQPPLRIDTNPRNQVARVAEGLAWDYYCRYIKVVAPGLEKALKDTKFYRQKEMPAKYFILLPYSCVVHYYVNNAEKESIENIGELDDHKYRIFIYKISAGPEPYYACADYCSRLQVLHEMKTGEIAALTPVQRAAELRIFYEVLHYLFTRPSAPEGCHVVKLVYYDDYEHTGRKLSEVLMDEIKESLQEEQDGGS